MSETELTTNGADLLVQRLVDHGVTHVFGYPGGQLTPIYDALHRNGKIRHVLARDEQAAAFMADGYARATGTIGVCFAVCGPGVLNALTPLATSCTDSVPVLLLSGQIAQRGLGLRSGYYHENEQMRACETCVKWMQRTTSTQQIVGTLDQAFHQALGGRQGPVMVEVPLDVQREKVSLDDRMPVPDSPPGRMPNQTDVEHLAQTLKAWKRPILLVGGGVISADAVNQLADLAERLGAPVFHSAMGKTAFPSDHPLAAGMPWQRATSDLTGMDKFFSPLFTEADGLLAIGCRFTQLTTGGWKMPVPANVAQIDIDEEEIGRHYPVKVGVQGDARLTLEKLLALLESEPKREPWTDAKRRVVDEPWRLPNLDLVPVFERALPRETILAVDVTRLAYVMMVELSLYHPRTFLHPAGYVTMGHGIPAALGARVAYPDRPIVAIVGDGCFQMTGMELATAMQEDLPIVIVIMNDKSLSLIKAIQERHYDHRYIGVDLKNPDFGTFAKAFGADHVAVTTEADLETALREAIAVKRTVVIEVQMN